jgi:beta-lactamase superfamily II metal-dependent hydrolase
MSGKVDVRMYRQGLGDCFLLSFDVGRERQFHMLIDCGALNSKHYNSGLMVNVVTDILRVTKNRLDVIVLTHEHWDHISGFFQAKALFEKPGCEVGEVWTAWTEDPAREDVADLKKRFKKKKKAVRAAMARMPAAMADSRMAAYRGAISELFNFFGGVGVASGSVTEKTWDFALKLGKNRYLDPKKAPVELPDLPGIRIFPLGPPDDPELIKKRLSRKETYEGAEHSPSLAQHFYAALHDNEDPEAAALAQPFDSHYRVSIDDAKSDSWFAGRYAFNETDQDYWRSIEHDWLAAAGELALHLDSYTNNTCLALAIELGDGGKVMLFPGDAQVGNWESWDKLSWQVKDAARADGQKTITSSDLLTRTALYKVGHHGSHNATMKGRGLERMESQHLVAMIPVHRDTAEDQNWKFPFKPLWERLKERAQGRVLLADSKTTDDIEADLAVLSKDQRDAFLKSVKHEEFCVRYEMHF